MVSTKWCYSSVELFISLLVRGDLKIPQNIIVCFYLHSRDILTKALAIKLVGLRNKQDFWTYWETFTNFTDSEELFKLRKIWTNYKHFLWRFEGSVTQKLWISTTKVSDLQKHFSTKSHERRRQVLVKSVAKKIVQRRGKPSRLKANVTRWLTPTMTTRR